MEKVTINFGYDLLNGRHYVRVDGYKSEAAYSFPEEHPNECFNCVCLLDIDIESLKERVSPILNRILSVVEQSVNSLLQVDQE